MRSPENGLEDITIGTPGAPGAQVPRCTGARVLGKAARQCVTSRLAAGRLNLGVPECSPGVKYLSTVQRFLASKIGWTVGMERKLLVHPDSFKSKALAVFFPLGPPNPFLLSPFTFHPLFNLCPPRLAVGSPPRCGQSPAAAVSTCPRVLGGNLCLTLSSALEGPRASLVYVNDLLEVTRYWVETGFICSLVRWFVVIDAGGLRQLGLLRGSLGPSSIFRRLFAAYRPAAHEHHPDPPSVLVSRRSVGLIGGPISCSFLFPYTFICQSHCRCVCVLCSR